MGDTEERGKAALEHSKSTILPFYGFPRFSFLSISFSLVSSFLSVSFELNIADASNGSPLTKVLVRAIPALPSRPRFHC